MVSEEWRRRRVLETTPSMKESWKMHEGGNNSQPNYICAMKYLVRSFETHFTPKIGRPKYEKIYVVIKSFPSPQFSI